MKKISFFLCLSLLLACQSEPKDCRKLIVQTWVLKNHEVNLEVLKSKSAEGLNSDDIAAINQTNGWQNIADSFVATNDTIEFTADGKYRHQQSETTYSVSEDCQKLTFEMSPGSQNEFTIHKLTSTNLVLDYIGIKMIYRKMEVK